MVTNLHTPQKLVADELSSLNSTEISRYEITDLSPDYIGYVFEFLYPDDLARVLLNIPIQDLVEIKNMFPASEFNYYLDILPPSNRSQVETRISTSSNETQGVA